jgi:hypothetical protein
LNKLKDKTLNKEELLKELYSRDGRKCHYCEIEETDFRKVWGTKFYGGNTRGGRLEVDRKDNEGIYEISNCVLACALCNMAKSNIFTYDEFLNIGAAIKELWQERIRQMDNGITWEDIYRVLNHVSKQDILEAMEYFQNRYTNTNDYDHWLEKNSYKYAVLNGGKYYPPKYIMGLATNFDHTRFYGGWGKYGVNTYFKREGFEIVNKP